MAVVTWGCGHWSRMFPGLGSEFCVTVLISSESSCSRGSPSPSRSPALVFVYEVAVSYGPMVPGWQLVALTRRCSQESLLPAAALLSPEPRMLGSRTREQCLPSIHCTHCAGQVSTVLYYRPGLSVLTASINRAQSQHSAARSSKWVWNKNCIDTKYLQQR